MLRDLSILYAITGFIGLLLITEAPGALSRGKHAHCRYFITTNQFIKLPIAISLAYPLPLYLLNSLKGSFFFRFQNDWGLSVVLALAAISSAIGRAFFGKLFQSIGFKEIYSAVLLLQALLSFTLWDSMDSWGELGLWVGLVQVIEGGHYLLLPATCSGFLNGASGGSLFAIVHAALALAAWELYALLYLFPEPEILVVLGGMSIAALLLVSSFEETYSDRSQAWIRALESPLTLNT
jgi:hypothetical protein